MTVELPVVKPSVFGSTVSRCSQRGETVKIASDSYGVRYEGTKASVIGKGKGHGTYTLASNRRKSPLTCHESHLEKVALERVA